MIHSRTRQLPNHPLELTSPRAGARGSLAQLWRWNETGMMVFSATVLCLVVLLGTGCGTMCALNSGNYITRVKSYDAAYLVGDRLVLSYTASVQPYARNVIHAPRYTLPAWAALSTTKALAATKPRGPKDYAYAEEIHLSPLPSDTVRGGTLLPILRVEQPWSFDCSKVSPDEKGVVVTGQHFSDFFLCVHDSSGQRVRVQIDDPSVRGRHLWGYPEMVLLLPIGLAVDIVTWPFQLHWIYTHE